MCGLAASSHNTHRLLVFGSFVNHAEVDEDVSIVVSKVHTESPPELPNFMPCLQLVCWQHFLGDFLIHLGILHPQKSLMFVWDLHSVSKLREARLCAAVEADNLLTTYPSSQCSSQPLES